MAEREELKSLLMKVKVESEKVGLKLNILANIGAEAEKGNALVKETFPLMEKAPYNFIGNVEARDIPLDGADVIVTDGFGGLPSKPPPLTSASPASLCALALQAPASRLGATDPFPSLDSRLRPPTPKKLLSQPWRGRRPP